MFCNLNIYIFKLEDVKMNNYPDGAQYDPSAPWNDPLQFCEPKRTTPEVCPLCGKPVYVNSYNENRDKKQTDLHGGWRCRKMGY